MPDEVVAPVRRSAWWRRVSGRMDKASNAFSAEMHGLAAAGRKLDDAFYDELSEVLIAADCGVELSERLATALRHRARRENLNDGARAIAALKAEILAVMGTYDRSLNLSAVPSVIVVVGVNGSGKTTTIGKLAWHLQHELGQTVLLGAADTFRAAAAEQLEGWAQRAGCEIVTGPEGSDPGAVAFEAITQARSRGVDVVIVDTAGRLHTQDDLMGELTKVRKVIARQLEGAPHETLLTLDATTGQNGLRQARLFTEAADVTGVVLTKLDGTARGGIALAIARELGMPVKLIGVGESVEDLRPFDAEDFARALIATG